MKGRITALVLAAVCGLTTGAAVTATPASTGPASIDPAARRFASCKQLNKRYPQGVGKRKAQNKVRGRKTGDRNHFKSNRLYRANRHLDRDKDGVACER